MFHIAGFFTISPRYPNIDLSGWTKSNLYFIPVSARSWIAHIKIGLACIIFVTHRRNDTTNILYPKPADNQMNEYTTDLRSTFSSLLSILPNLHTIKITLFGYIARRDDPGLDRIDEVLRKSMEGLLEPLRPWEGCDTSEKPHSWKSHHATIYARPVREGNKKLEEVGERVYQGKASRWG